MSAPSVKRTAAAALASVDPPAQLESPAPTDRTVSQETLVTLAPQDQWPKTTATHRCDSHPNALANRPLDLRDPPAQVVRQERMVMPEPQALTANPAMVAHADPTDSQDQLVPPATRDPPERTESSTRVRLEHQDQQAHRDQPAELDLWDPPAQPERTDRLAPQASQEPQATAAHPANPVVPERTEPRETRDRRDRATTVHQLVSHQDIKIITSPVFMLLFYFTTASHASHFHT